MSPKEIKHIDYWLGIPIVFVLTIWKNFISLFTSKKDNNFPPEKIIFIKLIEQGATVLAVTAIKRAIELVEAKNVYFLVFSENKPILEVINIIPEENIFTIRNKGFFLFVNDFIKVLFKIRRSRIDTAIDMEFFSRFSAIFTYISGAKNRIGNHRYSSELPYRGNLMTHKIQYNPFSHVSLAYLVLVESLLSDKKDFPLPKIDLDNLKVITQNYLPSQADIDNIENIVNRELDGSILSPVIILNPNTSDLIPIRKWDISNFIKLTEKLIAHFNEKLTIIITGGVNEITSGNDVFNKINSHRVINLTGKTELKELLALYSMADVLVTNDSGPGHFASMTKIKDIILFGPETPKLYGPLGENVYYVESNLGCRPCVNPYNHRFSPCRNNLCMQSISVEHVFNKVIEVIS